MNPTLGRPVAVVIDDDPDVRHLVETVLTQAGFEVVARTNGIEGVQAVERFQPLVTTLDVSMPGMDGFATARRIRAVSPTYLIMITAHTDEVDVIYGLEAGADDYVAKPFRTRELRARIETMLRRPRVVEPKTPETVPSGSAAAPAPAAPTIASPAEEPAAPVAGAAAAVATATPAATPATPAATPATAASPTATDESSQSWLRHNGLALNTETRVALVDDAPVALTRTEFDILASLLASGRRVRSKADLALSARGEGYVTSYFVDDADRRSVEVHVANLRRKLGESASEPRWIETVRGVGYRIAE